MVRIVVLLISCYTGWIERIQMVQCRRLWMYDGLLSFEPRVNGRSGPQTRTASALIPPCSPPLVGMFITEAN